LTDIRNSLLCLDTDTSSVATAADDTTVDSTGSEEVGDAYESVGVPVVETTTGEDDNRIVMDGLGVSMTPDQDEGHNSTTAGAHSEVVVDGIYDVADAGEILLSQEVTSSVVVQVPPLHLTGLHPSSPPTIRLAIPTGSSHSSDDSELEGAQRGATRCQHRILRPGLKSTAARVRLAFSRHQEKFYQTVWTSSPPIPRI
jgi:hypothetical protein